MSNTDDWSTSVSVLLLCLWRVCVGGEGGRSPHPPFHPPSSSQPTVPFGPYPLTRSQIFAVTPHSFAFVNLKPVLPGHVLIAPKRVAPRLADLTPAELSDLWALAVRVGTVVQNVHTAPALQFAVQDGPGAGQTVPHAHVHVMPRKAGDFERNDDVYPALEKSEGELGPGLAKGEGGKTIAPDPITAAGDDRPPRTAEVMDAEADSLRPHFE